MSEKLNAGQFPVLNRTATLKHFVQHQQAMPQRVVLPSGDMVETGYLKITEGTANLYTLCQNDGNSNTLSIKSIAYIDEGDNLREVLMTRLAPIVLKDPAYGVGDKARITVGFTTKICGLRWGIIFKLNPTTGEYTLANDLESPIVGIKVQFS